MKSFALLSLLIVPFTVDASGNIPLAGVANGQPLVAKMWDEVSDKTAGRPVTYVGYKAVQTVEVKNDRIYGPMVAFLVGNSTTAVTLGPSQTGLTITKTPEATAAKIAVAVRSKFAKEGFQRAGTDSAHPGVEHYCAPGNNERTLKVIPRVPGQLYFVMVGAPTPSSCP